MPRGITICISLKSNDQMPARIARMFDRAFAGFFLPHTASLIFIPASAPSSEPEYVQVQVAGGFEELKAAGMNLYQERGEFTSPWFRRLPSEVTDRANRWTTTDLPDCQNTLLSWMQQCQDARSWYMNVYGNLAVRIEENGKATERMLFRQLVPEYDIRTDSFKVGSYVPQALLYVTIAATASRPKEPFLQIAARSKLWLEQGDAFRGQARATARWNTERLAKCARECVAIFSDSVDSVERYAVEGQEWGREVARIEEAFSIIPGIELG